MLKEISPVPMSKVLFAGSGSEANDFAVKFLWYVNNARGCPSRKTIIARRNGYHGGTTTAMGLTAHGNWRFKSNQAGGIHHSHPGYCYRCPYGLTYPSCDLKCAHDIKNVIQHETSGEIACFIGEPVQGVGGAVVPPQEFFQIIYQHVRDHGGLCVADEVQGGFGRSGENYWSHQHFGVVPDMVVMAKGIEASGGSGSRSTWKPASGASMAGG